MKIDTDKPLPPAPRPQTKYPWDQMKPGDSFLVTGAKFDSMKNIAKFAGMRRGWTFEIRREGDDGTRVWRTT
jgi:hypothetical protein